MDLSVLGVDYIVNAVSDPVFFASRCSHPSYDKAAVSLG